MADQKQDFSAIKLSSGALMPTLGFGTWKAEPNVAGQSVELALANGYRHVDCAALYGNEAEIGESLKKVFAKGEIKREDVFLTSKLWNTDWGRVREACKKSIKDLGVEYLDLYLVHTAASFEYADGNVWPTDDKGRAKLGKVPTHVVWAEMEKLVADGLVKHIGVSNWPVLMINDLFTYAKIKPAVHQVEIHPYLPQRGNVAYCKSLGMGVTAYSPLGNAKAGSVLHDPVVKELAAKYKVGAGRILLRWNVQSGNVVLSKSTNESRIKDNADIFSFNIEENDMGRLNALERPGSRTCDLAVFWQWPYYDVALPDKKESALSDAQKTE